MIVDLYFFEILIVLLIGSLIGVQREIKKQKDGLIDVAGFRTFTLISLLGYFIGYLAKNIFFSDLFLFFSFFLLFIFICVAYFSVNFKSYKKGFLVFFLILFVFLLGAIIAYGFYYFSMFIEILLSLILFFGDKLHELAKVITKTEVFATIKFAIISLIILPVLPNKNYALTDFKIFAQIIEKCSIIDFELMSKIDVFNFYYLWLMVVMVSGIGFIGYILVRVIDTKKGIIITSVLGSFVSSTALSSSFAIESKKNDSLVLPFACGMIIACSAMFFKVLLEVLILDARLIMGSIIWLLLIGVLGVSLGLYIISKTDKKYEFSCDSLKSPFSLGPALTFALLFLFLSFFSKLFVLRMGTSSLLVLAFFSGITDVDAIVISIASLFRNGSIEFTVANYAIIVASFSNTFFKLFLAYLLGNFKFFKIVMTSMISVLGLGFILIILF